ncbi:MAG: hypothetical protein B7Z37_26410 [Verrucomicrobia bacterium 12-59-8]|nr:MAG: hypothetical protein B7Z37_26410 [Verrucomicrobia bacterium 12-59-8]
MANATQRTQATKDLQRERLESAVEQLLATYPYLIEEGLPRPKRQIWISETDRVDLIFSAREKPLVVEIKADLCDIHSVRQILRYINILTPEHPDIRGILIGKRFSARAIKLLSEHKSRLSFKVLNMHIPIDILICAACRRAYCSRKTACPYANCGSTEIIAT